MIVPTPTEVLGGSPADAWALRRSDPKRAQTLSRAHLRAAPAHSDPRGCARALLTLAFCHLDDADFGAATASLGEAEACFAALSDEAGRTEVGILRGVVACRRGDYDAALAELLGALGTARSLGAPDLEAYALTAAGEVCGYRGDYARSLSLLQEALARSGGLGDPFVASEARLALSRTYRLTGAYEHALREGLAALGEKRRAGDPLGEAYALNNLGLIYHDPHDSAEALACYLQGLALAERLQNRRCTLVVLGNLGELYADLGDAEQALVYVRRSLALSERLGSRHTAGISLEGLGTLYAELGDRAGARDYFGRALELRRAIGDKQGQASTLHCLGRFYGTTAVDRARAYLEESLALAREVGHPYTEARALTSLGELYLAGDPERALGFYEDALDLAGRMKLYALVRDCSAALAGLYEDRHDFRRAHGHLKTLYATDRRLADEHAARRTQRLLAKFELERAQAAAATERRYSAELARANRALQETNAQNAKLLERLREQTERLKQQATVDGLTGLHNRRYAERYLKREFRRAKRSGQPFNVAVADIDDFKRVNDHFSHAVGDRVLQTVGDLLRSSLRPTDLAARYGGEEFVLAFPETDAAGARAACEVLRRAVESFPWHELQPGLRVTLSLGCGDLEPGLTAYETMLAAADARLYHAKRTGKNQVVI